MFSPSAKNIKLDEKVDLETLVFRDVTLGAHFLDNECQFFKSYALDISLTTL